jgi:hypothetical protein
MLALPFGLSDCGIYGVDEVVVIVVEVVQVERPPLERSVTAC